MSLSGKYSHASTHHKSMDATRGSKTFLGDVTVYGNIRASSLYGSLVGNSNSTSKLVTDASKQVMHMVTSNNTAIDYDGLMTLPGDILYGNNFFLPNTGNRFVIHPNTSNPAQFLSLGCGLTNIGSLPISCITASDGDLEGYGLAASSNRGTTLYIRSGNGGKVNGIGGHLILNAGRGYNDGMSGDLQINTDDRDDVTSRETGNISIFTGDSANGAAASGSISIRSGSSWTSSGNITLSVGRAYGTGYVGDLTIESGDASQTNTDGGDIYIAAGVGGEDRRGGTVNISAGRANTTLGDFCHGGDVIIKAGVSRSTSDVIVSGSILIESEESLNGNGNARVKGNCDIKCGLLHVYDTVYVSNSLVIPLVTDDLSINMTLAMIKRGGIILNGDGTKTIHINTDDSIILLSELQSLGTIINDVVFPIKVINRTSTTAAFSLGTSSEDKMAITFTGPTSKVCAAHCTQIYYLKITSITGLGAAEFF